MSKKKQIFIVVLVVSIAWFINLVVFSDENVKNINYFYYRFKYGGVINIEDRCFGLPDGWYMVSNFVSPQNEKYTVTIAENFEDGFNLVNMLVDNEGISHPKEKSRKLLIIDNDIEIYEANIPKEYRIRFWAKDNTGKTIIGDNYDLIAHLMVNIKETSCN